MSMQSHEVVIASKIDSAPLTIGAAFKLSLQLVGLRPILRTLILAGVLLTLLLIVIPITLVLHLDGARNARVNDLQLQMQTLQVEMKLLQDNCAKIGQLQTPAAIEDQSEELEEFVEEDEEPTANKTLQLVRHRGTREANERNKKNNTNRGSTAAGQGKKGKKALSFKQFRGDAPSYTPTNECIQAWREDDWGLPSSNKIVENKGWIAVKQSGLYLVNAQLTFWIFGPIANYNIQVQPADGTEVDVGSCYVHKRGISEKAPATCSTSILLCLKQDEKIRLFVPGSLTINLDYDHSYLSLLQLNSHNKCPPIRNVVPQYG